MALQGALGIGQDRSEPEMAQANPAWHRFLCEALQDLRKVRALFGVAIPKFDRNFFEQERDWPRSNRGWHTLWVAASSEEERLGRLRFIRSTRLETSPFMGRRKGAPLVKGL